MTGDGEGDMSDVLKRLGAVETSVVETRIQVASIAATLPSLATKATVDAILATLPSLATKADLNDVRGQVNSIETLIPTLATKADLYAMESKIIKWIIATVLATAGVVFSIAKFVH